MPNNPTERLFSVMKLTAERGSISAIDAVRILGLPRPTAYRMIDNLAGLGFLQRLPSKGDYVITQKLASLGATLLKASAYAMPIETLLFGLSEESQSCANIAVLRGGRVEFIHVSEHSKALLRFEPGIKGPLHCSAAGQVFLASLTDAKLADFLQTGPWERYTANTITDPKLLERRVKNVRHEGYSITRTEWTAGITAAALPIRNTKGNVVATLGIHFSEAEKSEDEVEALLPKMRYYSRRISKYF
jgi:DNA-binding IclR family transcriptional regulator